MTKSNNLLFTISVGTTKKTEGGEREKKRITSSTCEYSTVHTVHIKIEERERVYIKEYDKTKMQQLTIAKHTCLHKALWVLQKLILN